MTRYSLFTAFLAISMSALLFAQAFAEERNPTTLDSETTSQEVHVEKSRYLVDFKDHWTFSPKTKLWCNEKGEKLSAEELLSRGQISLRPVLSENSAFDPACQSLRDHKIATAGISHQPIAQQDTPSAIRLWDDTKLDKIRIMFTGSVTVR